jgi:hypothetical protein
MKFLALAFTLSIAWISLAWADDIPQDLAPPQPSPGVSPQADFPLYEAPFNFESGGYDFPSMKQSVALSTDFYQNTHRLIGGANGEVWSETPRFLGVVGFDLLSYWLPLGTNWMRSEWGRAVLTRNDISSYDQIYKFHFFSETIKVTNVSDTDLSRLKAESNGDFVRMSSAGFESWMAQNLLIEKTHFFDDVRTFDQFVLWMNALTSTVYLSVCGSAASNVAISKMHNSEGTDVNARDFTGLNCTSWVYDLFTPGQPYSARGPDPSGVGINRYISNSQLSSPEQTFLHNQQFLSLLNFADPFLYGRNTWDGHIFGTDVKWMANLAHSLTSFGYVVDGRVFLMHEAEKFLLTLHNGFGQHFYPGLTAEWIEHPIGEGFGLTSSLTLWAQPKNQLFNADTDRILIDGSAIMYFHWTPLTTTYFGLEAKSPGWILTNPYLDANLAVWTGVKTTFF